MSTGRAEAVAIGLRRHRAGDLAGAEAAYRSALEAFPGDADLLCLLGAALLAQRRPREAAGPLRLATAARPGFPEAHLNLGVALTELRDLDAAVASLRAAIDLRPGWAEAHGNLGAALRAAGRPEEAEASLQHALTLDPGRPEALMNLGVLACDRGDVAEAIALHERSLALRPGSAVALLNLGNALRDAGRCEEAEARYEAALRIAPELPEARYNRGLNRLLRGDFARGWDDHEWRLRCRDYGRREFDRPMWEGEPLRGRTLLIHAEQGLGDTLQFVRYAALVPRSGGRVLFECPRALAPLLARTPGIDALIPRGDPLPDFDVHEPLMSLPRLCGPDPGATAAAIPYLHADPARVAAWRPSIRAGGGLVVGVAWQGSRGYAADRQRSFPLAALEPLARIPGVRLVSLQRGDGAEQVEAARESLPIQTFGPEFDAEGAFVDTAAVMRSLDLVITPDSAPAHLAGALGVPAWVALPPAGGWRWQLGRADSPWYPSLRLFRAARAGEWGDVVAAMAAELGPRAAAATAGVTVQVTPGELIDRITILELKARRIADPARRAMAAEQLRILGAIRDRELAPSAALADLAAELAEVNAAIWDAEADLRACEAAEAFGPAFVALARSVYRDNDRRAALKRQIDAALGSPVTEVKWHPGDGPGPPPSR